MRKYPWMVGTATVVLTLAVLFAGQQARVEGQSAQQQPSLSAVPGQK